MNQDPEREWAERHTAAMLRAEDAAGVLAQLHIIRDRLATMQGEADALAAGFQPLASNPPARENENSPNLIRPGGQAHVTGTD